jgi:hypothetical protein
MVNWYSGRQASGGLQWTHVHFFGGHSGIEATFGQGKQQRNTAGLKDALQAWRWSICRFAERNECHDAALGTMFLTMEGILSVW